MNKDKFIIGLLAGLLWPVMVYGILLTGLDLLDSSGVISKTSFASDFHTRTLSLVAIGCNIFFMQYFNKKRMYNAMRGMVLPTMVMAIAWLYTFYDVLF